MCRSCALKWLRQPLWGQLMRQGLPWDFWSNLEDLRANWRAAKTWEPDMPAEQRDQLYKGWLKAVERTFNWVD